MSFLSKSLYPFAVSYHFHMLGRYVVKNARQLGVRQDAIMLSGAGAGGNLAASVALQLRDKISMQVRSLSSTCSYA